MFTHISVYKSRVKANIYFLALIMFIIDLAVQMHLQACLVCEDPIDGNIVCLNFSAAQMVVLNYTLFVNLPDFLKVKAKQQREETASRSIMIDIMSAPGGANKASRRESKPRKGTKVTMLNVSANQSMIVDAEKFKVLQNYQTFCPNEQGTDICMKYHFQGFCYK
jgi:hypothetical protein